MGESACRYPGFMENWVRIGGKKANLTIFCLAIVLWGLWTTRNKIAIEGTYPSQPIEVLFKINVLSQKWRGLLKEEEKAILEERTKTTEEWLKEFIQECKKRSPPDSFM